MSELVVKYGISGGKKITNIVIGIYLIIFSLYFCITEGVASRFDILFCSSLIGVVMAAILLLSNTLWLPGDTLRIDSNSIEASLPGQSNVKIEWTTVSQVNIGVSYIVLLLNGGQKQRKLDLSNLIYSDVTAVKSKIVELSEFKNIPYQND
ncbi:MULTISPECIES: hypothetical protein [unclassified Dysgonomonas]|uniref:hypothetical protein n=1 Tax=unclassified Dysgonomonas TaxID=2630389 RepID=UPI0013EC7D6E|nr:MULTISPECIES: hypothetical protein [unclassified Dysgonomonas]